MTLKLPAGMCPGLHAALASSAASLFLVFALAAAPARAQAPPPLDCPPTWEAELCQLKSVVDVLRARHASEIDVPAFLAETIRLGVKTLPYAQFRTAQEWKDHLASQARSKAGKPGLGITFETVPEGLQVIDVIPGSAADKAGVLPGDRVVRLDGHNLAGASGEQLGRWAAGELGSALQVLVLRGQPPRHQALTLSRALVKPVVARARWLDGGVLYTRLASFPEEALPDYLAAVHEAIGRAAPPTAVLLDLRANGGGAVNAFVGLVALFTGPGRTALITATRDPNGTRRTLTTWPAYDLPALQGKDPLAGLPAWWHRVPLVVLVDGQSASAAEAAAAALKDAGRASVLGLPTYGKGLVQADAPVRGQAHLVYTSARTLRANGCPMEGYGLVPDFVVPPRADADLAGIFLAHREADIARPAYADVAHPDPFADARKARQQLRDQRALQATDPARAAGLPQRDFAGRADWQVRQALVLLQGGVVAQSALDPGLLPPAPRCEDVSRLP